VNFHPQEQPRCKNIKTPASLPLASKGRKEAEGVEATLEKRLRYRVKSSRRTVFFDAITPDNPVGYNDTVT